MTALRSAWIGSALTLLASSLAAQVMASEPASVTQTIDGTRMTIEYSRPRARGRKDLIGGEVKWGEVWTGGANKSTTFETSKDITLDGHPVPKGKYSVWLLVRKKGPWSAMLDTNTKRFHTQPPDTNKVAIRFDVTPGKAPYTETLTWGFDNIRLSGAQLAMRWGTTTVAMDLAVQPSFSLGVPEAVAAAYVGWYDLVVTTPADTGQGFRYTNGVIHLEYRNGSLVGKDSANYVAGGKQGQISFDFILLPNKDGSFWTGILMKGELAETMREAVVEFKRTDGKVTGLEERYNDKLQATYSRRP